MSPTDGTRDSTQTVLTLLMSGGLGMAAKTAMDWLRGRRTDAATARHTDADTAEVLVGGAGRLAELVTQQMAAMQEMHARQIAELEARHAVEMTNVKTRLVHLERWIAAQGLTIPGR